MQNFIVRAVAIVLLLPASGGADEITRQVQEELRRRHLFFNEIDGRTTPDLTVALRRYQERQGFAATGTADSVTLRSLGVLNEPAPPAEGAMELLPDVPVLRSDSALPGGNRETRAAAPTAPPAKAQPITKKEAAEFVRRYVAACESPNINDEVSFYAEQIDYFDHGMVDRQYVKNEVAVYDQRWPRRTYKIANNVRLTKRDGVPTAKFRLAFEVANGPANRRASGSTDETFGLARRADGGLEIISIREQRVRRASSRARRARSSSYEDPVVRGARKVFRSIFRR